MLLGILFAVSACFVWGLIFVIPEFLSDFSTVELVVGRYLSYGILSCALLFRRGFSKVNDYTVKAWILAFIFALLSNIIYYLGIISGLRFASPPITVLLIGMAPILITFYGNWRVREISYRDLIFPSIGIGIGMILVNIAEFDWSFNASTLKHYVFGVAGVIVALVSWSWYAVNNARFLKLNPHISPNEWATVIGVGTLFWTVILGFFFSFVFHQVEVSKFLNFSPETGRFLVGVIILGVVCSWVGCFFWNRASSYLPVSLMGPFLIFETIFGLFFVFLYQFRLPSLFEFLGVITMLGGILLSVYIFKRKQFKSSPYAKNSKPELCEKPLVEREKEW